MVDGRKWIVNVIAVVNSVSELPCSMLQLSVPAWHKSQTQLRSEHSSPSKRSVRCVGSAHGNRRDEHADNGHWPRARRHHIAHFRWGIRYR